MLRMIVPLCLAFLIGFSSFADAQDQRSRRRAFVEDLLRGLIDSQTPDNRGHSHPQPGIPQPRPIPGTIPQPNVRPVVVEVTPTMIKTRKSLNQWNTTCVELIEEIRVHEVQSPQLRPLLGDALQIQAEIELLCRKSQIHPNLGPLKSDFQKLDSDWRMLNYRLNSSNAMTNRSSKLTGTIATLDKELCGLFRVEPQFNRVEVQRLTTKMASDYDHLLHDLYFVCRSQPNGRQILTQGQELQALIAQSSAMIGRGSYEDVVGSYKQCMGKWKTFHRQIQPFEDERIRRTVSGLEDTGGLLREQLWLPAELDREYLASLSNTIGTDSADVFNSISLARLMNCKAPGVTLNSAREFHHACVNFSNSISSGASLEELKWDFRLFEVQWDQMHHLFHEFEVPQVDNRLEDIEYSMATLKRSFGDVPVMSHGQMRQLSSNLGALFQQTSLDIHRRVVEPTYQRGFKQQICGAVDKCSRSAAKLNRRIIREPDLVLQPQDFNDLFVQWRTLKPMINQCQGADKQRLLALRRQIEPLMVKLQVVYAE